MTGQVYGRLTILGKSSKRGKTRDIYWTCRCSCGNIKDINGYSIRSGSTSSCGCLRLDVIRKPPGEAALNKLFGQYLRSAKNRGLVFDISKDLFQKLVTSKCYYCGDIPNKLNGIDRIDSSNGYIEENCRSCCKTCNTMKWNLKEHEFIKHIEKIYANIQRRS